MHLTGPRSLFIVAPLAAKGVGGLLWFKVLAQSSTPEDFGRTALAIALVGVLTLAAGGAVGPALIARSATSTRADRAARARLTGAAWVIAGGIVLCLAAATWAALPVLATTILDTAPAAGLGIATALAIVGSAAAGVIGADWSSQGRYRRFAAAQCAGVALALPVALACAASGDPALATAGFAVFPGGIGLVMCLGGGHTRPAWPAMAELAAFARPVAARLLIVGLVPAGFAVARLVHGEAFGWQAVAAWAVAQRLAEPVGMVCGLLATHLTTPAAARGAIGVGAAMRGQALIAAALLIPIWLVGPWIVPVLFAKGYAGVVAVLPVFFLGELARIAASGAGFVFYGRGRLVPYIAIEAAMAGGVLALAAHAPAQNVVLGGGFLGLATAAVLALSGRGQTMKSSGPRSAGARPASEMELKLLPSQ